MSLNELPVSVSIIIPVHNAEGFLERTLKSVVEQRFSNYELICINDNSSDNSQNILNNFLRESENNDRYEMSIIQNEKSLGAAESRNIGIRAAKGRFIFFCDADDIMSVDLLSKTYNFAIENKVEMVRFYASSFLQNIDQRVPCTRVTKIKRGVSLNTEDFIRYSCKKVSHVVWTMLISREFILKNNLYFEKGIMYEDTIFVTKLYYHIEKLGYLNEELYFYRLHKNSVMGTANRNKNFAKRSLYAVLSQLCIFKNKNIHYFKPMYKDFYEDFQIHIMFQLFHLDKSEVKNAFKILREYQIPIRPMVLIKKTIRLIYDCER